VTAGEVVVVLSIPDVLGALVLKRRGIRGGLSRPGSAPRRAAVLACAVTDPIGDRAGCQPGPRGASGARERL